MFPLENLYESICLRGDCVIETYLSKSGIKQKENVSSFLKMRKIIFTFASSAFSRNSFCSNSAFLRSYCSCISCKLKVSK